MQRHFLALVLFGSSFLVTGSVHADIFYVFYQSTIAKMGAIQPLQEHCLK